MTLVVGVGMRRLQATWCPPGRLFFWTPEGSLDDVLADELPELGALETAPATHPLTHPDHPTRRRKVKGVEAEVSAVLPLLPSLRDDPALSDSLRCWSAAARLGLELAARQAVAPKVTRTEARWQGLLHRREDRRRFEALVRALPPVSRARPTRDRGSVRLHTSRVVVRAFLDTIADLLYRQSVHPGPVRSWALELADALRGDEAGFQPRDARYVGIPDKLAAWAADGARAGLRLGMTLEPPGPGGSTFTLQWWLHPPDHPDQRVPLDTAWDAGESVTLGQRAHPHPALATLQGLARAQRIFEPLGAALSGRRPRSLRWTPTQTWAFLSEGARPLIDGGFEVELPEDFDAAGGAHRIRARMRIEAEDGADTLHLGEMLRFRWEVTLGDRILSGPEFAELLEAGEPIVRFRGDWVLLDPAELARLPDGLPKEGRLDAAAALRAVLTGQHDGVPVVADDRLELILDALREPPDHPVPETLQATLRPYQVHGYAWLTTLGQLGLGACLADDMGLGKTIQVISHILQRAERGATQPSLVVCPTSVLGNWQRELQRFAPGLRSVRYHGLHRDLDRAVRRGDVVLTTYGVLARDIDALEAVPWDVIALDEAQAIKNPESKRARAARRLKGRHRVAMSGTPVENRLDELWSLMEFLVPGMLGPRRHFHRTVAVPVEKFGDEDVARRLRLGVSPFLLRRVKTDPDIIDDLPDKVERVESCALTAEQADLYRSVAEESLQAIATASQAHRRGQVLKMLTALKQICNHPAHYLKEAGPLAGRSGKLERAVELLDAVLGSDDRAIVFTQYRQMGDRLIRHFQDRFDEEVPFLHGGVPSRKRDEMVRRFQEDDDGPAILVISLRAGGTGLNLTRANHVLHYDRWWNPAVEDQATDRAYRIGQHRNVQVHKFVCQGTLEERIDRLLEDKRSLAASVVGTGERLVTELDDQALRALVALGDDVVLEDR